MTLALAALAVAAGAGAQSVSGIGFALVGGPLLFSVFGAREGVRVAVVLSMLVNVGVLAREHRAVMWRRMSPVLVTALVVTPVLAHVLSDAHPRALRALAGAVIVLGAGLVAAGRTADTGLAGGVVAGLVSATMPAPTTTTAPAHARNTRGCASSSSSPSSGVAASAVTRTGSTAQQPRMRALQHVSEQRRDGQCRDQHGRDATPHHRPVLARQNTDVDEHRQHDRDAHAFTRAEHSEEQRSADERETDAADRLRGSTHGDRDRCEQQSHCCAVTGVCRS